MAHDPGVGHYICEPPRSFPACNFREPDSISIPASAPVRFEISPRVGGRLLVAHRVRRI